MFPFELLQKIIKLHSKTSITFIILKKITTLLKYLKE